MAKQSQIEKVLASLRADRHAIEMAIVTIVEQLAKQSVKKQPAARKVRTRKSVLGEPAIAVKS